MCRLAAFPPGFSRIEALKILSNFECHNTDGTGSAFVHDGKFVVNKWPIAFSKVLRSNKNFLAHMPYNGWTIAHLRAASHGEPSPENTHPFVVGPWAFIHNGIWSDYDVVKLALSKFVTPEGDTDSAVAAHLWNLIGPKKFAQSIDYSGVFMGLKKNGSLWVAKTNGDLEIKSLRNGTVLLASEFDKSKYNNIVEALQGYYHFSADGKYRSHKENKDKWASGIPYKNYPGTTRNNGSASHSAMDTIFPHGQAPYMGGYYGHSMIQGD